MARMRIEVAQQYEGSVELRPVDLRFVDRCTLYLNWRCLYPALAGGPLTSSEFEFSAFNWRIVVGKNGVSGAFSSCGVPYVAAKRGSDRGAARLFRLGVQRSPVLDLRCAGYFLAKIEIVVPLDAECC